MKQMLFLRFDASEADWRRRNATSATRVKIGPIEAFDGTPVIDIKSASTGADR